MYKGLVYPLPWGTKSLDPYLVFPVAPMNRKVHIDEFVDTRTGKTVAETMFCIREFYHKRMTFDEVMNL